MLDIVLGLGVGVSLGLDHWGTPALWSRWPVLIQLNHPCLFHSGDLNVLWVSSSRSLGISTDGWWTLPKEVEKISILPTRDSNPYFHYVTLSCCHLLSHKGMETADCGQKTFSTCEP